MSEFELPKKAAAAAADTNTVGTEGNLSTEKQSKPESSYSSEELLSIFDEIIFSGTYLEVVDIKGRLKVSFRTRTAEEAESIGKVIDTTPINLVSTLQEKRLLLNLHLALVAYQSRDLSSLKLEDRAAFINKLPAPIVGVLMNALVKFDSKVFEACKEAEQNF